MIVVTGSILAREDSFDEVLRSCIEHVERSRKEPGCISHDVHVDCQNPMRLFFFEQWADEAALRTHFAVEGSKAFVKSLKGRIVETSGTKIYRTEEICEIVHRLCVFAGPAAASHDLEERIMDPVLGPQFVSDPSERCRHGKEDDGAGDQFVDVEGAGDEGAAEMGCQSRGANADAERARPE